MSQSSARVVLVTGASSGFGRAIAEALIADGHIVYGSFRQPPPVPPPFRTLALDVTSDESVARAVDEVIRGSGRIDAVVNNAGMGIAGAIEDTSMDEARAQLETNFFGTHRVCRAVLPHLRARGGGHIVNISSLAGRVPIPFQAFYSASKFAIEAYTEALRMEVRAFGVQVAMIEPGDFATGFTANRRMAAAAGPGSVYADACGRAIARMAKDEQANKDLTPVVDAVRAILGARTPALRWPRATLEQRVIVALRPFLPAGLWESLIRSTYGLG